MSLHRNLGGPVALPIDPVNLGLSLHDLHDAERAPLPRVPGVGKLRVDPETPTQGPVRKHDCDANTWLSRIYRLCEQEKVSPAIALVFDMLDDLLFGGNLARCDEILRLADVNLMPVPVILSFLTITMPARSELSERLPFFQRAGARLGQLRTKEKAADLLAGLG